MAPSVLRRRQVAEHLLVLRAVGDRAHLGVGIVRVAEPDPRRARSATSRTSSSCTSACTISREPAMQVWPVAANTPATTPLAAAARSASANTTCGDLPPSSSVTLVEVLRGRLGDRPAGRGGAGERDLVHAGVPGQRGAGLPRQPRHHVDDPGGKPASANSRAKPERGRRGVLGRLDHDRAARRQRGRELPGQQQQRRVPRRDRRDHADRLAPGVDEVVRVGDGICRPSILSASPAK